MWKPGKQAGSLVQFPAGANPHTVFNYAYKSSNNSGLISNAHRVTGCEG